MLVVGFLLLFMFKFVDFGFVCVLFLMLFVEMLCGLLFYMVFEIFWYEWYDVKVDLWLVGIVLYEMVIGRFFFRVGNYVELFRKIEVVED